MLPQVSVMVPCRNEGRFIAACLESILGNGYPGDRLEVLVVDGMSTDGTRQQIESFAARYPNVRLIANQRLITPAALNLAIRASNGAYLLWMSAHSRYEPGYIQRCVEHAEVFQADNTGGAIVTAPRDDTVAAPYIVAALTSRFGVGGARFRFTSGEPRWTDTVFGGCYRRDVFDRIGVFNEALVRGQDMEFNLRLRRAGLRTLLVPRIHSVYYARTRVGEFALHNWTNGVWAILPWLHVSHPPVAWRHLVPLVFAAAITLAAGLAVSVHGGWWPLAAIGAAYLIAAGAASLEIARRHRDWSYAIMMPPIFLLLHLSYGYGSLWGMLRLGAGLSRAVALRVKAAA
ncbi:MAG TPA: glycosyltransferase family 2 protein [Gemmatimonadales bacterium]|jgi:glycosyltransferase involved in cell wall biosynthesis